MQLSKAKFQEKLKRKFYSLKGIKEKKNNKENQTKPIKTNKTNKKPKTQTKQKRESDCTCVQIAEYFLENIEIYIA